MQDEIRDADENHFPELNRFINYKKDGELSSPLEVAQKYVDFLNNSTKFKEVLYSVRDL
jgi:benzil reductase ((S)-benzoin forming)